jgi:hypothetical protein
MVSDAGLAILGAFQPSVEETELALGHEPKAINGRGHASTRFTVVGYPHVTSGTSDGTPISSRDASSLIRDPEAIEASYFPCGEPAWW